jgi:hypothetical protein
MNNTMDILISLAKKKEAKQNIHKTRAITIDKEGIKKVKCQQA